MALFLRERHDLSTQRLCQRKKRFGSTKLAFALDSVCSLRDICQATDKNCVAKGTLIWRKSRGMKLIQPNAAPAPASRQPQGPWHQRHHEARQRLRRSHLSRDPLRRPPARNLIRCTSSSSPPTGPASSHGPGAHCCRGGHGRSKFL